jgi:hypothetical protein
MRKIVWICERRSRSKFAVISLVSGRAETGRRNAEAIQKQINKLEAQLAVPTSPAVKGESGVVEIVEELDESGNVVGMSGSSHSWPNSRSKQGVKR